ncbi:hypothetical protein K8089_12300 [Aequorivita sp. F47161]|uniref:Uncharacterized protein n=1 Tax=Aequorivita vitellina TaxID=2874475 RepID=A0A9X1R085_9FLAO|nr:UPF0158 family protein [Aequorivita vitellina]MCG2419804.1 hypothetical protein [Aequorivita vitellina]
MDNSKQNIINQIAQKLDCGYDCYYNPKTNELITIPNFGRLWDEDEFRKSFAAELKKVTKNKSDYIKFEVLESFESFKIMERFIAQIPDKQFQLELENILVRKKPFQNFKNRIDYSVYRQNWFDFKQRDLEKIVETQLNRR